MGELSIPSDDSAGKGSRRSRGENGRAKQPQPGRPPIASREECLAALSRLPSLVALGLITTAQANTIRATYSTLLQSHERQQNGPVRTVDNELVRQLRKNPALANLFKHLLTKEEIEIILRGDKDAKDEPVEDEAVDDEVVDDEAVEDETAEDADDADEAKDVENANNADEAEDGEDPEDEDADVDPFP
jgi:hypothetical protein